MNAERISYEGERLSIGIDVHRREFVVSVVHKGRLIKRCRMVSGGAELMRFIRGHFPGASIRTCYEAGFSGFWLHRYLAKSGIENIVVNPASIETEANNRVKTDKRDSQKMAEQLDANRLRGIYIPSEAQERSRLLTRTREQLLRARTRVRVQIRMKLHQFGIFPAEITTVLTRRTARDLIRRVEIPELKMVLEALYAEWEHLAKEMKSIERAIVAQAGRDPLEKLYRSVAGVGQIIARVLANELGDMKQFPNEKALFSYTGLTPSEYSSGESVHRGHITRQGNSRLRHVLVEAAWRAIRKDVVLKAHFETVAKRRGKKIAIVSIARKLVGRIRAVLKSNGEYVIAYQKAA